MWTNIKIYISLYHYIFFRSGSWAELNLVSSALRNLVNQQEPCFDAYLRVEGHSDAEGELLEFGCTGSTSC